MGQPHRTEPLRKPIGDGDATTGGRTYQDGAECKIRNRTPKKPFLPRLLKKVQMQGGAGCEVRGVLGPYAAAPRERANTADGPFSAACYSPRIIASASGRG
jgi:hypothetical protein